MVKAHAEQEIQKFKNYREQCYQIIDLSLVNQATKQESHAEVVRSVQQVLFREKETDVVRKQENLKKQMREAMRLITKDQKEALDCGYPPLPGEFV